MLEPPGKALRNRLRVSIAAACSEGELTAEEFAKRNRVSVRAVNNQFRALERAGILRHREVQVRGVSMHVYSAALEPVITNPEFAELDPEARGTLSESVIRDFFARCWAALRAGTLDARDDSHLSWLPLGLDEQGWKDATDLLSRALDGLYEIQADSSSRLRRTGETPIPTVFGLAGFEAPAHLARFQEPPGN